jgi:hypothetical protein
MLNKERSLLAAEKGKAGAEAGEDGGDGEAAAGPPGAAAEQADLASCPICLDELSSRTITACGHHYCPPCIREVLAHGTRLCPICRTRGCHAGGGEEGDLEGRCGAIASVPLQLRLVSAQQLHKAHRMHSTSSEGVPLPLPTHIQPSPSPTCLTR